MNDFLRLIRVSLRYFSLWVLFWGFTEASSLQWAVRLHFPHDSDQLALDVGFRHLRTVGTLQDTSLYASNELESETAAKLTAHSAVKWFEKQIARKRVKRRLDFTDPKFGGEWHLVNSQSPGHDLNVSAVWKQGVSGNGVTVAIVDDGIEWKNKDLTDNYSPLGSYDINSGDDDPTPRYVTKGILNRHGTRCAGEVAAVPNNVCSVGLAFGAKVAGIRMLDGDVTDSVEAHAFSHAPDVNDIYSCSWGPDDSGKTTDGPHTLAMRALVQGVVLGRHGYGSVYVFASGNGGRHQDSCNYDGYANSVYTLTVGAVAHDDSFPAYAESCSALHAVAYSSGSGKAITTTDWNQGCTSSHSGTSAAAPLAAALVALMLESRPCLTWRDVQHIVIMTARKINPSDSSWHLNQAGLHHNNKFGFGIMDAWRLVAASQVLPLVPPLVVWTGDEVQVGEEIPSESRSLDLYYNVSSSDIPLSLVTLEHVQVHTKLVHSNLGDVEISLVCPSKTPSVIGQTRPQDRSSGKREWTFATVRCWGESPTGTWTLRIRDTGGFAVSRGTSISWQLILYGSSLTPSNFKSRMSLISQSVAHDCLPATNTCIAAPPPLPCPSTPNDTVSFATESAEVSATALKFLVLFNCTFCITGSVFVCSGIWSCGGGRTTTSGSVRELDDAVESEVDSATAETAFSDLVT